MTGEEVTRISLGEAFRKRFHHPYALIHRADLLNVLLDACRKSKMIRLDSSQKVVDVEESGSGITVKTASGNTYRGAALVGADGLWSTIRQIVVGDGKPKPAGHITYRAVLPTSAVPEEYRWKDMAFWAGEKVHLVLYPLRTGDLYNLVAVFHSNRYEEGWDIFGDPAELHERFAGKCAPVRMLLDKIESWRMWVLCDRPPIKEWSKGRITLLGDAAHPMLQYLAQGACMSIEDAVCLADKVVAAKGDYASAFQAYQNARYLRTGRVQIMARIYGEFYHAGGVAKELRNLMLGGRTPEDAMAGMEWLYGKPEMLGAAAERQSKALIADCRQGRMMSECNEPPGGNFGPTLDRVRPLRRSSESGLASSRDMNSINGIRSDNWISVERSKDVTGLLAAA